MDKWTKEERKAIGSRIQYHRKQKGLLQEDLANLIGLKLGTISKYEQGDRTPGIRQLTRIAEVLECSVLELISPEEITENTAKQQPTSPEAATLQNPSHTAFQHPPLENAEQTDFDAFLQWLHLSSIQVTPTDEEAYLLQIGSKTFPLTKKALERIMGFLKKQFLKILIQMAKKS